MKTLTQRLKADISPYFRKIRIVCIAISATGTVATTQLEYLPTRLHQHVQTMVAVGLVGTFLSQLTVAEKEEK